MQRYKTYTLCSPSHIVVFVILFVYFQVKTQKVFVKEKHSLHKKNRRKVRFIVYTSFSSTSITLVYPYINVCILIVFNSYSIYLFFVLVFIYLLLNIDTNVTDVKVATDLIHCMLYLVWSWCIKVQWSLCTLVDFNIFNYTITNKWVCTCRLCSLV